MVPIRRDVFNDVCKRLRIYPTVDLFAHRGNAVVPRFVTPKENAFKQAWSQYGVAWLNPPFSLWKKVVEKLRIDPTDCLAVVPEWPSQPWYQELTQRMEDRVMITQAYATSSGVPRCAPKWRTVVGYIPRTAWTKTFTTSQRSKDKTSVSGEQRTREGSQVREERQRESGGGLLRTHYQSAFTTRGGRDSAAANPEKTFKREDISTKGDKAKA